MAKVRIIFLRSVFRRGGPFLKNLFLFQLFLIALLIGLNLDKLNWQDFGRTVPALAGTSPAASERAWWNPAALTAGLPDSVWRQSLNSCLPVLAAASEQNRDLAVDSPELMLGSAVFTLTNINVFDPKTYLAAQISTLGPDDEEDVTEEDGPAGPDLPAENIPPAAVTSENIHLGVDKDKPLIGIYTTHNAETYIPTDGKSKLEGQNAGVAKVAQELTKSLEESNGVPAVYIDRIHDYPKFTMSYVNSAQTVKYMLKNYPSLVMLVDVHRDSLPSNDSEAVEIDGKKAARILFIVGTDARSPHPNWEKNDQLAAKLAEKTQELYPGLLKGVRRKDGTYNQTLHPGAVLVEFGNDRNSLDEALVSARCLANVIREVLLELPETSPTG